MPSCFAEGCRHAAGRSSCQLFRFPSDSSQRQQWIEFCGRKDREWRESDRLCSCHFVEGRRDQLPTIVIVSPLQQRYQTDQKDSQCASRIQELEDNTKKRKMSPTSVTTCDKGTQCILQSNSTSTGTQTDPITVTTTVTQAAPTTPSTPGMSFITSTASSQLSQQTDQTYQPSHSETDDESMDYSAGEKMFLVEEGCLQQLLIHCTACHSACELKWTTVGTFTSVHRRCLRCDAVSSWASQSMVNNIPTGNLRLSAAVLFCGTSFLRVQRVLSSMNVATTCTSTFHQHASKFLIPTIRSLWISQQESLLDSVSRQPGPVVVGGDMRADSPGHCAKYGSYSLMDLSSNRVIHLSLIQSNEVGGSNLMEKEGLVRSLQTLEDHGISPDMIITDRHPQIQKHLRECAPSIEHCYDVWHVAKGLCKKLQALGNEKGCDELRNWTHSVLNHLYWSAASSNTAEEVVAKWLSVANHVQNVHAHDDYHFPKCLHGDLTDQPRKWLTPSTKVCERLSDIITNKKLLGDIAKLSRGYQTSSIEAFHSLLLQFAPKMVAFSYNGMLCRLLLAVIHYNENADRDQQLNANGEPVFHIRFPKSKKGEHTVTPVKEPPTYRYVEDLMSLLFSDMVYQEHDDDAGHMVPPPLSSQYKKPVKTVAVASFKSRFHLAAESQDATATDIFY